MGGGGGGGDVPETSQEKAAAEVAMQEWNRYQDVYVPLENEWMDSLEVTDSERSQVVGETAGIVTKQYDDAQKQITSNVAPGSGKFTMATTGLNAARGKGLARATATADQVADDTELAGLESAVQMGRGQATEAQLGMGDIAARSVNNATSDAVSDWKENDDTLSAVGGLAGVAATDLWRKK